MISVWVFLIACAGYVFSMAPGIVVGDSGEFCAAAATLSLPHSPGYPLYVLLGKVLSILMPFATVAYRVNLLSALSAAVAVTALYYVFLKLLDECDGKEMIAASAALIAGASAAFVSSAAQAEVFTLNSLFLVLILYALLYGKTVLAGFLFGLGLGNHQTLLFVLPFATGELYRTKKFTVREITAFSGAAAMGISIYLVLLLRAQAHPPLNWGDPENLHNLWRVISRADYGSLSLTVGEKIPFTFPFMLRQLHRYLDFFLQQFTVFGAILGAAGWWWALRKGLPSAKELFMTWLLIGPGFLLFANLPFNGESNGILERFYILPNLFFVFGVLYGIALLRRIPVQKTGLAAMVLCASLFLFSSRTFAAPFRWNLVCHDYGRNILRSLPYGSILFIDGGDDTFYSLAYFTFARRLRPDIEVHDRGAGFQEHLRRRFPATHKK